MQNYLKWFLTLSITCLVLLVGFCCFTTLPVVLLYFSPQRNLSPNGASGEVNRMPRSLIAIVSPDSNSIYYDSSHESEPCIKVRAIDGLTKSRVLLEQARHPFLSRDGKLLFFQRNNLSKVEIWRLELSSKKSERVIVIDKECEIQDVDLEGRHIILSTYESKGGLGLVASDYIVDAGRSEIARVDGNGACFLANGARVVSKGGYLWLVNSEGQSKLCPGFRPLSSHDGARILYREDKELKVLELENRQIQNIGKWFVGVFSIDGKAIIGLKRPSLTQIMKLDIESGKERLVGILPGSISAFRTSQGGIAAMSDGSIGVVLSYVEEDGVVNPTFQQTPE